MSKLLEEGKARPWGVHCLSDMFSPHVAATVMPGRGWVASVAEPYRGGRLAAAWWILTGRAHAIVWPKPGDLEATFEAPARATQEQPE